MDNSTPTANEAQTYTSAPKAKSTFFIRLFSGRLSRSAYIIGILFVMITMGIAAALLFAILSLFFNPTLLTAFLLGIVFVVTLFFAFSMSLRRLHDLNRSGWFLLLFLPGEIGTFFFLIVTFSSSVNVTILQLLHEIPPYIDMTFTVIRWIANVFTIYMVLWPGNEEENKFGLPVGKLTIKAILGFSEPTYKEVPEEVMSEEYSTT